MTIRRQTTLRKDVSVSGIGVHSGLPATLTLHPAEANTGIVFLRTGVAGAPDREIPANVRAVTATEFATVLGDHTGPICATAEHVLAALSGLGVDNALVEIDGPEVPIMDGSAEPFVAAIEQAGVTSLLMPRRYIQILKRVAVARDNSFGELRPYAGAGSRSRSILTIRSSASKSSILISNPAVSAAKSPARVRLDSCAMSRNCGVRATRLGRRSIIRWW
jgi:UDP-3-O-acyl-N-acetylglucosamine deacetylase